MENNSNFDSGMNGGQNPHRQDNNQNVNNDV